MTTSHLALAILALLVTPGPTNTLVALAGAERGWRGALPLISAEIAGYLVVTIPLALAGQALLADLPILRRGITLLAALWVLWLALRLWQLPQGAAAQRHVDGRAIFVTTILNPKALIFGLVLLPAEDPVTLGLNVALLAGLIVLVAMLWAGLGTMIARPPSGPPARAMAAPSNPGMPLWLRRATALWLAALALWLAARGAGIAA